MTTPPSYVTIAGMQVPTALVPRIVAALRGTYPTVTEGLGDNAAIRAVLRWWVQTTLAEWEGRQAEAPVEDVVTETRRTFREKGQVAREKAMTDATAITTP